MGQYKRFVNSIAHDRTDRGANLVEFALVVPLLLLLVLGIVEFGLLFGQSNEVRHAAREGARYGAVSNPDYNGDSSIDNADVLEVTCDLINLPGNNSIDVSLSLTVDDNGNGSPDRLDYGTITVEAATSSLTGAPLVSNFIPSTLSNSAVFRLEQDGAWTDFGPTPCP